MTTIGLIGLGNMGRGMAHTLMRAGHAVLGFDADPGARTRLAGEGVQVCSSVADVAAGAVVIILSLPAAPAVEAVVAGPGGLLAALQAGSLVIDTTTSHPATSRKVSDLLATRQSAYIDAPVSGGPKGAISGTMTMLLGGTAEDIARAEPILAVLGKTRVHVGPCGAGHLTKLINNLLCAAHLLTAGEALAFAQAAGLDPERIIAGLNAGSGRSGVTLVNVPTWILNGAFDSGFTMKLMRKDVALAADVLADLGLELPIAQATAQIWSDSAACIADAEDFNRIVETVLKPSDPAS